MPRPLSAGGSTRIRDGHCYIAYSHDRDRETLDTLVTFMADAFVDWESGNVLLQNGKRKGPGYVLWTKQHDEQQDAIDFLSRQPEPTPEPELEVAADPVMSSLEEPATPPADDPMALLRYQGSSPKAKPARTSNRRPKTTRHKGITRIDHPAKRTFGYFVRVTWQKETRSKFFSDRKHGDRLAALSSAIEWRDATEEELGKPRSERQVIGTSRTDTGIVGVRRTIKEGREVYEAAWREGNRVKRTSYSIAKHGERKALAKARQARALHERARQQRPREE